MRFLPFMFAAVCLPVLAQEKSGAEVYQATCIECHGSGKLNAPKFGDTKRWKKLASEGLDDLVPAALQGIRKMPAKGGYPALTDREVALAVVYMANAGGGKLVEPTPADITRWRQKIDARNKR